MRKDTRLSGFHMAVGIAVLATNLVAAGWGAIGWLRKDARASIVFWPLLRLAQATVVVQAVLGLLLRGPRRVRSRTACTSSTASSPLFVTLVSEGMRVGVAQRELEGVEDIDALERSEQVALAKRVALGEMGVMTVGRAADPDAGAARVSDGRLGESGVPEAEHHAEDAQGPGSAQIGRPARPAGA